MEPPVAEDYLHLYNPQVQNHFGSIITFFDDLVDNKRYFKYDHPQPNETPIQDPVEFENRKLCVMVQTNRRSSQSNELFSERRKIAAFFPNDGEFDLYGGNDWNGFANWRGWWDYPKAKLLKNYKFVITYENMRNQRGYITERIFDALFAQCVPIYWGATNIADYIPKECFVDRMAFSSNEDLYQFMKSMDKKTFIAYLIAGQEYLKSPAFKNKFTPRSFGRSVAKTVADRIGFVSTKGPSAS